MRKFKLNAGGVVGAVVGLAAVGGLYLLARSNPNTSNQSVRPLLMLAMITGIIGNKIWERFLPSKDEAGAEPLATDREREAA